MKSQSLSNFIKNKNDVSVAHCIVGFMDAIKYSEKIAQIVSQGRNRKYYRFRAAPFYGGIATADCVGCFLKCIFCWSWNTVNHPERVGKFYTPEHVVTQLVKIASKKGFSKLRISGNEPTLNRDHLLAVLEDIPSHYHFILETNGIVLGHDRSYCKDLAHFQNIHVRISLKGCNPQDFEHLTGMDGCGFNLQIQALEHLIEEGVSCHPAAMTRFSKKQAVDQLQHSLYKINPNFQVFETEELLLYPPIEERLRKFGFL